MHNIKNIFGGISIRVFGLVLMFTCLCSYAREWQAKLRELQESSAKLNKNPHRRSPSKDGPPPLSALPLLAPPQISITPSITKRTSPHLTQIKKESPIKMDSNGALNLASSPSPPAMASNELTSTSDGSRSPATHQRAMNFGVETCVVCGDRASGKSTPKSYALVVSY